MLTRAFLMCSDPKALEAVSQVLGELEITFETFPDPSSAAKRLANQRFDPILVDCDNVPNATVVFDSVRQSGTNQSSMTIAIVDGKAGVPTAFRLGARLVMTKPVSLEQARSTLRNALAMQRREHESKTSIAHASSAASAHPQDTNLGPKISEITRAGESPIPPVRPSVQPPAQASSTLPSENITSQPSGAKIDSVPAAQSTTSAGRPVEGTSNVVPLKSPRSDRSLSNQDSVEIDDATATQWEEKTPARGNSAAPSLSATGRPQRKTSPFLVAVLTLLLVAGACYAAFTMQPAFHDGVVSEYEDLHALITGSAAKTQAVVAPPRPTPVRPSAAQNPGISSARPSNAPAATAASSSAGAAVTDGFAPAQAAPSQGFKGAATTAKPAVPFPLPTSTKTLKVGGDTNPVVVAEDVADAHVAYRVRAIYPYAARRKGVEGAVVLLASVNTDGSVDSVRVMNGNPQLAPSAVEAVKQWRYEPYYASGRPVAFQTKVTVRFQADSQ
jgi:TonB family protein